MRKRYPQTVAMVAVLVTVAAVLAISAVWHPFAYIFLGCVIVALIGLALHDDRKHKP